LRATGTPVAPPWRWRADDPSVAFTAVVVDDQPALREAVVLALTTLGVEVVGLGGTGDDAVALAAEHRPDVMILDDRMPARRGFDAVPDVRRASPGTCIVIFSGTVPLIDLMDAAHRPDRVVSKTDGLAGVAQAVEVCLRGRSG
jgi:DNA-binding NarL/FixJ family response regulator